MANTNGPGVISRFWLTVLDFFAEAPWGGEYLGLYLDGPQRPSFEMRYNDLYRGNHPFDTELAQMRSGSFVSYQPLAFDDALWVTITDTLSSKVYYYEFDVFMVRSNQRSKRLL